MEDKSMKGLLFAIAAFCIISLSCSFFSQKCKEQNISNDTVVCSELLFDTPFEEKEYFVVTGKDTSAYSCTISSRNGKCGTITLYFFVNDKYYMHTKNRDKNDTTAVGEKINLQKRRFRVPCYKEMLHEIDLCIEAASKNNDVTTLNCFSSFLSDLGDIAILTTNNLNSNFIKRKNGLYDYSDMEKALNMTSFVKDLNKVLNKYGIEADELSCGEMRNILKKDIFLKQNNISKDLKIPDRIMDVQVYVKIKNID